MAKKDQTSGASTEYAFNKVPESAKVTAGSLFMIWAGYAISLADFVSGTTIGYQMNFRDAILSCLIANLILVFVGVFMGRLAYRTGLTTSLISRKAFGKKGSIFFSAILCFSAVNWVAVNGDTFGQLVSQVFTWWPLPVAITAALCIVLRATSAINGISGLKILGWVGVPCALVLAAFFVLFVQLKVGLGSVITYQPPEGMRLSFMSATASFIGTWIFGCTISPDICRFAKKESTILPVGFISLMLGQFGLEVIGIITAQATKQNSFTNVSVQLGLGVLVFFCSLFALWTTQANNMYSAGLAFQNILADTPAEGKVKNSVMVSIIAVAAAIFAACGATNFLLPITNFLSVLVPPITGLMMGEYLVIKRSKENKTINWIAIASWIAGAIAARLLGEVFITAIVGIVVTFVCYVVLSKLLDSKVNADVM